MSSGLEKVARFSLSSLIEIISLVFFLLTAFLFLFIEVFTYVAQKGVALTNKTNALAYRVLRQEQNINASVVTQILLKYKQVSFDKK